VKNLLTILLYGEGELLELCIAFQAIGWGVWILLPHDAFAVSEAFHFLAIIAPEFIWGGAALLMGLILLIAIPKRMWRLEKLSLVASLFLWSCVTLSFILGGTGSVGTIVYTLFAFYSFFCLWRNGK